VSNFHRRQRRFQAATFFASGFCSFLIDHVFPAKQRKPPQPRKWMMAHFISNHTNLKFGNRKLAAGDEISSSWKTGLPDFSWHNIPKRGKIYQISTTLPNGPKYTKWPQNICTKWSLNIPNDHKLYQHFPFLGPPKFTQIGILGLKTNHLATLLRLGSKSTYLWQKLHVTNSLKKEKSCLRLTYISENVEFFSCFY
jgi:hypothetical protein